MRLFACRFETAYAEDAAWDSMGALPRPTLPACGLWPRGCDTALLDKGYLLDGHRCENHRILVRLFLASFTQLFGESWFELAGLRVIVLSQAGFTGIPAVALWRSNAFVLVSALALDF